MMYRRCFAPLALLVGLAGFTGLVGGNVLNNPKEHELRVGNIPSALHPEWKNADRCTKCHMTWSWEFGYYRGWDRHGFISDYSETIQYGYKDPYGLDAEYNPFAVYYSTDWWNGPWLEMAKTPDPAMHFDGYGRVNDGTAKPGDFTGSVIVVDQSGRGDARTIQEGVDKAAYGSTVFVKAGIYRECVRLQEGIRLWGEDVHKTIINPDFTGSAITAANHCDISGFTLTGTGMNYKDYTFNSGVHALDCDSTLVIRGNIFDSNAVFGILVESSRVGGAPKDSRARYISQKDAHKNLSYTGYPNPRIIGNTFYVIGERAVFSLHASPEIANNVFIGNVKTLGMTQHSRPFIHHNVFYRNNVTVNMNRSMPILCNNIMFRNYWGQRIIEGALPSIHDNVTWESPYYKEFTEDGGRVGYQPVPGTGEKNLDPRFADPDGGNFTLATDSPLASGNSSFGNTCGLVSGPGIQQPPVVPCKRSYAEEFNNRNEASDRITAAVAEKVVRENTGGLYLDYDQYLNGAIGPMGTFFYGYLTLFGGAVDQKQTNVDGKKCVVISYPNIGSDLKYRFYLDPSIGYQPRKLEQYVEGTLYRKIDRYTYEMHEGIAFPISVTITDYGTKGSVRGKVAGTTVMKVRPGTLAVAVN